VAWRWFLRGAVISATEATDAEALPAWPRRLSWLRRYALPVLFVCAAAVYFVDLGNSAIWDANEAFYVETPREMLEAHDFINPTFNYLPRFNKPVLSYWIVGALYRLFGVSVAVQRFAIALGAMIIIGCAYALAQVAWDPGPGTRDPGPATLDQGRGTRDQGPGTGLWAAAGLAAAPRLVMFARRIFIDIWITAFTSLTLTFFALSERYPQRRRQFLVLMYVSIGLGVLTKGPVAIALPALAFVLYLSIRRELRRVTELMLPTGVVIVAVIVIPWYAALYHEHGWADIRSFFVSENIERFTSGVGVRQPRGPWFYLPVMLSDSFPWSVLLPVAAVAAWKRRTRFETLLWCWIVAIVGFFSLSAGKQDLYILPIIPAVAALGGMTITGGVTDGRTAVWLTRSLAATGALLAVAAAAVLVLFGTASRVYALDAAFAVGALGVAGGILTLFLALARKPDTAAMTLLAAMTAVNWVFVVRVLPEFERYKPVPVFSQTLEERLRPGDVVAHYQVALPSMAFYLRRHVDQFFEDTPFIGAILSEKRVYAVLSADDYASLAPRIAARTCVIDRRPTFEVKLRQVFKRQPLPELLLITNKCN
jgi:4-amino-4-deoxy-L-arabinose transferase-like glycosyltransferase